MALIPLSKFKDIAKTNFSVSEKDVEALANRGFLTVAKYEEGRPLYDDYFVSDSDAFNKIISEYNNTSSYLTAAELSESLSNKGINISSGAIEQMAKGNLIESYKLDSGYCLFKPDILLNVEELQIAYDEFEAKEAEEETLDELELDEDGSDTPQTQEETHNSDEFDDWDVFEDEEDDEKPKKKKSSSAPTAGDSGETARIEEFKKQEAIKAEEAKRKEAEKRDEQNKTSESSSSFTPPVIPVSAPPSYVTQPQTSDTHPHSYDTKPTSSESQSQPQTSSTFDSSYSDYLRASESDDAKRREYDESVAKKAAEEKRRREEAAKHEKVKSDERSQLRDEKGNFTFTGYHSGEQSSSASTSLFPDYDSDTTSQEKYSPSDVKKAEELVSKSYISDIASHNIISQNGMNEIIEHVRSGNGSVELPMKDGSYLKFEPVPPSPEDPYKSSNDYKVTHIEPSADYSKTTETVLYSSEQSSTSTSFSSVTDAYASSMGIESLASGYKDTEQAKTDNRVLYAIGVMPETPTFAQNPDGTKDHASVYIPAGVEYINPAIVSSFEQSGVTSVISGSGSESSTPLASFNPTTAHENQFVASAYLGSEEQMGKVLSRVDADRYISNAVSAEEYSSFVNKVQISNVTTDTVLSEAAISKITDIVKTEERKVEIPMRDGSLMTFEPVKSDESKTDFRVTVQSPSNGDYSTVTSKLIYSSESSETQAVSFGSVYSSYASGMSVDKLEPSASTPEQTEKDRRVLFAVGAVTTQEVAALTKDGTASIPRGVDYVHESIVSSIESSGAERIRIDNQTKSLEEHKSKVATISPSEITQSVYLGSYQNIERVTAKSEASSYFKERFSVSQPTLSPTTPARTPIGNMQDSQSSSSGRRLSPSSLSGGTSTRVAVVPEAVRAATTKPPAVAIAAPTQTSSPTPKKPPVVLGNAAQLADGDYSLTPFSGNNTSTNKGTVKTAPAMAVSSQAGTVKGSASGRSNEAPQSGGIKVAVNRRSTTSSGPKPATVRTQGRTIGTGAPIASFSQSNEKTGRRISAVVMPTGKTSTVVSYKEGDERTTIELLGSEANSTARFIPANATGIERQAIVANNRARTTGAHIITFNDSSDKTHIATNPEHVRNRAAVNRYIQGNARRNPVTFYHSGKGRDRGNPDAAYAQGLRAGLLASSSSTRMAHALKTGDFASVSAISLKGNAAAQAALGEDGPTALISKGMRYKDDKRAKKAQKDANFRMLGRQIGRISGLSSSGDYLTTGAKALFGYTSPIAIMGDLSRKSSAKSERLCAEKKLFASLLNDDIRDLDPEMFNGLKGNLTTARGRTDLRKTLAKNSKATFGKDITRFTTFKMKEILKTGKFNGENLTDEQRKQMLMALKLRGYSVRDYTAFDISDNLSRRGVITKGTTQDGKSFDLSGRERKGKFVAFDLSKRKDLSLFRKNLDVASLQFSSELGGLRFSQLSQDQLEKIAKGKGFKVGKGKDKKTVKPSEALKSAAGAYLKTGDLLQAQTKERQSKKGRFSRLSILARKLFAGTDAMDGLNAVLMMKEYARLAMSVVKMTVAINKSIMRVVKRMYKATIGRIFRAIGNSRASRAIKKFAHNLKEKIRLKFKNSKLGTAIQKGKTKLAERRARRVERKDRKAFKKQEKKRIKKIDRNNKKRAFLNRHQRINKVSQKINKGRRMARNARGRLNGIKNRFKKIGNAIAKPFRALAAPFKLYNKLKAQLMKLLLPILKYLLIAVVVVALLELILTIVAGTMGTALSTLWSWYESAQDMLVGTDPDSNQNGIPDEQESHLNQSPEASLMRDRVNFCLNMDSALKIYLTTMGDTTAYDEKLFGTGGKNPVVQYVTGTKEIKGEEEEWYDPTASWIEFNEKDWSFTFGRAININTLGFKLDDAQTGIDITYYDGDGNVVGMRSNAKDIVSMLNAYMTESFAPKGLAKSYVEKLWNFSHAVTYVPKKQSGGKFDGKFIYACDPGNSTHPCHPSNYPGTVDDETDVTEYTYYCDSYPCDLFDGRKNVPFYRWKLEIGDGDGKVLTYLEDDSADVMKCIHVAEEDKDELVHFKRNGCSSHANGYTYHGGKGSTHTEAELKSLGCKNIGNVSVSKVDMGGAGITNQNVAFCKGCKPPSGGCGSECHVIEVICTTTLYHNPEKSRLLGDESNGCSNAERRGSSVNHGSFSPDPSCDGCAWFPVVGSYCAGIICKNDAKISETGCNNVDWSVFKGYYCGGHYEYYCGGHPVPFTVNACGGYCPSHTFKFCKGHVDLDISVVTLFLDDNNGLTKLGVPKSINRTYELWNKGPNGDTDQYFQDVDPYLVEVHTPVENSDDVVKSASGAKFDSLYEHVDVFKNIKRNVTDSSDAYLLPLPDPKLLKEDIRMQMTTVDNKIVANNETVDTLRFFYFYSSNDSEGGANGIYNDPYVAGKIPTQYTNMDQLVWSYFVAFNYQWQDMNDSSSLDGVGTGSDADTGIFEGAPKHVAGYYHKFWKTITWEGWYKYSSFGTPKTATDDGVTIEYQPNGTIETANHVIVPNTDMFGNIILNPDGTIDTVEKDVYYTETQHVSRAKTICRDDWQALYNIDFPGSYSGIITEEDRYILMRKAWSVKHGRGQDALDDIDNDYKPIHDAWKNPSASTPEEKYLTDLYTILDTICKTQYTADPISNIKYVEFLYSKFGKPAPWGASLVNKDLNGDGVKDAKDDEIAVRYIHENKTEKGNLIWILDSKEEVQGLRTGDIIVIANELYVVYYNESSQGYTDEKDNPLGSVVCATVAGGGYPRLVAFSAEGLCKPGVGYGFINTGLY